MTTQKQTQSPKSKALAEKQQKALDTSVKRFTTELRRIMQRVQSNTIEGITDENYLERLGGLIQNLERMGLNKQVDKLKEDFAKQYKLAVKAVRTANPGIAISTDPKISRAEITALIDSEVGEVKQSILSQVDGIKAIIQEQVIVGSLDYDKLESLADDNDINVETLARTSLMTFYRTSSVIEARELGLELFWYSGPNDDATRPFCDDVLNDRTPPIYTIEEILDMDNGQGLDVLVSGGGYNCRHTWDAISEDKAREMGWEP